GSAYFFSDRTADAVRTWKRSLELRPDANVRAALERAERESSAESSFTESDTSHFNFHYEGGQTSDQLRHQITETLETHYNELVGELGITPRDSISVSLYTNQAYFDVTQAPAWSAALNDGKLRITVEDLTGVTSSLSQVLKHELALRGTIHGGYADLEEGIAAYLKKNYGP